MILVFVLIFMPVCPVTLSISFLLKKYLSYLVLELSQDLGFINENVVLTNIQGCAVILFFSSDDSVYQNSEAQVVFTISELI